MRLVIQGRAISVAHLTHIHRLVGGNTQFMQVAEYAYYLPVSAGDYLDVKVSALSRKSILHWYLIRNG